MGNPKFRLSEMIPNSWFPKLHHVGNPKSTTKPHQSPKQNHPPPSKSPPLSSIRTTRGDPSPEFHGELPLQSDSVSPPRKSYYFTREFHSKLKSFESPEQSINPPLKSARRSRRRRPPKSTTIRHSPVSSPEHRDPPSETFTQMVASSYRNCRPDSPVIDEESDFVIEVDDKSLDLGRRKTGGSVSSVDLRPIRTERNKFSDLVKEIGGAQAAIDESIKQKRSSPNCRGRRANGSLSVNVVREDSMASSVSFDEQEPEQGSRSVRRTPSGSPRFKIRVHSPRIARRVHSSRGSLQNSISKKGVSSKSLAVVKTSCDPQKDFRESMVEMIVENKITSAKDLEELLACYLSLNSDQYHDVIIQVFAQIWFDLNDIMKEIKK